MNKWAFRGLLFALAVAGGFVGSRVFRIKRNVLLDNHPVDWVTAFKMWATSFEGYQGNRLTQVGGPPGIVPVDIAGMHAAMTERDRMFPSKL